MGMHYEVQLRRLGRWWNADVPALSLYTQGRTLEEAESAARDAIAAALQMPGSAIAVDLVVPEASGPLLRLLEARAQRAAAVAAEQSALADAAHLLIDGLGLNHRDAGRLLGVPPEHLAGLVAAADG